MNIRLILLATALAALASTSKCNPDPQAHVEKVCTATECAYTQYNNQGNSSIYVICRIEDDVCNGNPFGLPVPAK